MQQAVIVSATRTAIGIQLGALARISPLNWVRW